MAIIESDQQYETPLSIYRRGGFIVRYAYSRSADAQEVKIPGEDYFVFKVESQRIAFALADGVGSSFMGNIGAQIVAETAREWLWTAAETSSGTRINPSLINEGLTKCLNDKLHIANALLISIKLEGDYNQGVYQAFQKKRDQSGTQANLLCGMIELPSQENHSRGRVWLAGLGDAHLRCWSKDQEITANDLTGIYSPGMGWSSKSGVIGEIHSYCTDLDQLDKILLYSDGLNPAHDFLKPGIPDKAINELIEKIQTTPDSDDISFLEITVDTSAMSNDIVESIHQIRSSASWFLTPCENDTGKEQDVLFDLEGEEWPVEHKIEPITLEDEKSQTQKIVNWLSIIAVLSLLAATGFVFGFYFFKILFDSLLK